MDTCDRRARVVLLSFLLASTSGACRSGDGARPATGAERAPSNAVAAAEPRPAPTPAADALRAARELVFPAQPGWERETPTSALRKAQFRLPRVAGDAEDASLVVFHFGAGGGGGHEANLARWAGQFEQPDGSDSRARLVSSTREVAGLDVLDVALDGTYVAETAPGSGTRVRKEGWRMLASIVASDHGAYYVKLVGPAATVAHWEPSYRRSTAEVRPGG